MALSTTTLSSETNNWHPLRTANISSLQQTYPKLYSKNNIMSCFNTHSFKLLSRSLTFYSVSTHIRVLTQCWLQTKDLCLEVLNRFNVSWLSRKKTIIQHSAHLRIFFIIFYETLVCLVWYIHIFVHISADWFVWRHHGCRGHGHAVLYGTLHLGHFWGARCFIRGQSASQEWLLFLCPLKVDGPK